MPSRKIVPIVMIISACPLNSYEKYAIIPDFDIIWRFGFIF